MTEHIPFHDEQALLERLQDELADGKREVVVLAGSALTMPLSQTQEHAAIPGVPLADGIVQRIRANLGASGDKLDEALRSASNRYQAAFEFLRGRRSADAVNRLVRAAVLEARLATAAPPSEAVLAGDHDECSALELDTNGWALSPGVEALGRLAAGHPRFGKRILTTNFDPLIEVAIGCHPEGAYHVSVLHGDGSLGQTSGRGTHVVHLHGHWSKTDMLHTQAQLLQERPHLSRSLKRLLSKHTFLVVAYSGWDDVFTRALAEVMADDEAFPDVIWTFYDADESRIRRERAEFFASLAPGIGRGLVAFYRGINVHTFLPRLAGAMLGIGKIDPQSLALEKYLSTGRAPLRSMATPATYLVARHQVVPFAGRERELATLDTWADSSDAVRVLLVHGPGGMGKTRLLTEWLAQRAARHPGDAIGFLTGSLDDAVLNALCTSQRITGVIDYAEERAGLIDLLMRLSSMSLLESGGSGQHVRLVLLARNAGDWWASLRGRSSEMAVLLGEPPLELRPLTEAAQDARMAEYRRAQAAFAQALQRQQAAKADPALASTTIMTQLGAEPDLQAEHFERPLYVHMAALSAVLGKPQTGAPRDILDEILAHEQRYWAHYLGIDPMGPGWRQRAAELQQAAAAVVVRGACANEDMPLVMKALALSEAERICALLRDLYPDPDPVRAHAWVAGVEPDLIAEVLLCSVLERRARPEPWLVSALTGIEPLHWGHAFTVLGRMGVGYDAPMMRIGSDAARALLRGDVAGRVEAAFSAALTLTEHTAHSDLGRILTEELDSGDHVGVALALHGRVPEETVSMRELAVWVDETVLNNLGEDLDPDTRAGLSNNLGVRYKDLGRREEALAATERAVAIYEELAQRRPDAFLPGLAESLHNLGVRYGDLGRWEEALSATERVVQIREKLAATRSDAFLSDLAGSLANLGLWYSKLGRASEALAATERAVGLYEELARRRPAAFGLGHLATSLSALGLTYRGMGKREEALTAMTRAVGLYEELAAGRPDAFLPDLARNLSNLGGIYSELGRWKEAFAVTTRAVGLYEELAAGRPAIFLPDLALSLHNLGVRYSEQGRPEEAFAVTVRAVQIYEELAAERRDVFLPALANSLHNLGVRYGELGRWEEALEATARAVQIREELTAGRRDVFLPDLAMSLNNLGLWYSELGRREEAFAVTSRAVGLYEELAAGRDVFVPDLAGGLTNLGLRYSALGRWEEALAATERSVQIREKLAAGHRDAFLPDLANGLTNLGVRYSALGRWEEVLATMERAVGLYEELAAERRDAFLPDLARSLAVRSIAHASLSNLESGLRDITTAVGYLWPHFERLPARFAGLMGWMLSLYAAYLDGSESAEYMADLRRRYTELTGREPRNKL